MWITEIPSLFSDDNVEKMRRALDHGLVFGLHAFYCGGIAPETCAFAEFDRYVDAVQRSKPGDWFTLWDVNDPDVRDLFLLECHGGPPSAELLKPVEDFLRADPSHEFIAVGRAGNAGEPQVACGDIDSYPDLLSMAGLCGLSGDLYVLPLSSLEGQTSDGRYRGKHAVVDAKRPNERGEVPIGGPY
jgi:hypothetical protein